MKKTILILLFMFTHAFAADDAGKQLLQRLSTFKSMTASFVQIPAGKVAALRKDSMGTMAVLKPGRFRWDIDKPNPQLIIADGKQLWIYDADLKQVTVQNLAKSLGATPAQLLSGDASALLRSYRVKRLAEKNECYGLQARSQQETFRYVALCFQKNDLKLMRLSDNLGHTSYIQFSQVAMNPAVKPSVFHFDIPNGVDVVQH